MLFPIVVVAGLFGLFVGNVKAVPVSVMESELSNSLEDSSDEDMPVIEDDITTHGLERLSSAATCLVAGVEYTHGQQIYRKDPCEFCLCLDGEMFCWWQDCPPTMEGPCKERGPFSPCISIQTNQIASQAAQSAQSLKTVSTTRNTPSVAATTSTTTTESAQTSKTTNVQTTSRSTSSNASSTSNDDSVVTGESENNNTDATPSSIYTEDTEVEYSSEDPNTSTAQGPKHCLVMGKIYQIGDQLPHDTGNCVECICNHGPKVTCSPHQCSPIEDEDLNEYHPPGPRQPIPDVF